jgi:hypothetical protein
MSKEKSGTHFEGTALGDTKGLDVGPFGGSSTDYSIILSPIGDVVHA